nr:uncharacterized protein LOC116428558 [Nomia melanderi]
MTNTGKVKFCGEKKTFLKGILLLVVTSKARAYSEESLEGNSSFSNSNCSTADFITLQTTTEEQDSEIEIMADVLVNESNNDVNTSHLKTFIITSNWEDQNVELKFPNTNLNNQYKITSLNLDKGIFIFDFLRRFLSIVHPYDLPPELVTDTMENGIDVSKLMTQFVHLEAVLIAVIGLCFIFCCILPATELWLACRPIREDYKPTKHTGALSFLLAVSVCVLGIGMITIIICNEEVSASVKKFPTTVDAALQDLQDYHGSNTVQLRKRISRSLDIASEAVLKDLDDIEELLAKPIQIELFAETGLEVTLDALLDLINGSQEVSNKVQSLLTNGDKASNLVKRLNREIYDINRNLESLLKACTEQDRLICNIIDSSELQLILRIDQFLRDHRLLRLQSVKQENLTETVRQTRGEFLHIPQYIGRRTLEIRNQIRREINRMRAKVFEESRSMEVSNSDFTKKLDSTRRIMDSVTPYVTTFDQIRWFVGLGTVLSILLIWLLLFGATCCQYKSAHDKVRPTLLSAVCISCFLSIAIWVVFAATLVVSSHAEMLLCRPLYDPNYRVLEAILETKTFVGRRLSVPLRDLFTKCRENEAVYPSIGLGNSMKLEQLTAYWTWSRFNKILIKLRVELKSLKVSTPNLQQQLQNLLYAYGLNLTEHRIMIQGPILNKDLEALADQVEKVARQMHDKLTARSLETIAMTIQDLSLTRLKPLMVIRDELVYKLAGLELQVSQLQRQVEQTIYHVKTTQMYIENQGDKMAELKTKIYIERLNNYLDQWRSHVLSETQNGVSKCRPLWEILEGIRLLLCSHFLGNMCGQWFATFLCAIVMMASTPAAHILSLVHRQLPPFSMKNDDLPNRSDVSQPAAAGDDNWHTPE